jgi:hypothetical protein
MSIILSAFYQNEIKKSEKKHILAAVYIFLATLIHAGVLVFNVTLR